jgi:hypothetical protein
MMTKDQTTVFLDYIREYATQHFINFELTQLEVHFTGKQERRASTLYRFTVSDKMQSREILVKVPVYRESSNSEITGLPYSKPRLFPKTELKDKYTLEYIALSSIYEYFSSLEDKQLKAICVLDYLPQHQAILVEASKDLNLRELFLKTSRFYLAFPHPKLDFVFQNAGKWLRYYHAMPKEDHVEIRHAYRHEYVEAIARLTEFLSTAMGDKPFFNKITSTLEVHAHKILPDLLPLGLGHGDFAMRNILVDSSARVTVIDTLARWRTPIYEDIGYFLNGLKLSAPQVISQGLAFSSDRLKTYENLFLKGYFEKTPIPYSAIRLYEILALLDKWSSVVADYHQGSEKIKISSQMKISLINRYFKISANRLLSGLLVFLLLIGNMVTSQCEIFSSLQMVG